MPTSRHVLLLAAVLLSGCASTSGYHNPNDPFEPVNRFTYEVNDTLDRNVVKPVAKGYTAVMPDAGRVMVNNFFSNLNDVVVTVNDLLQLKFVQAFSDSGRVLINTTIGAFGLVDAASVAGFPKHDEDFGQTLGYWGIASGPYLVLPVLGPSSMRDGVGVYVDSIPDPIYLTRPVPVRYEVIVANGIRKRANLLEAEGLVEAAVLDRYSFIRDYYLSHRENLVYDGNPPRQKKHRYEEYEDEDPPSPAPTPAPDQGAK
jgi:phospholipid-binding lipoprotein MlaA